MTPPTRLSARDYATLLLAGAAVSRIHSSINSRDGSLEGEPSRDEGMMILEKVDGPLSPFGQGEAREAGKRYISLTRQPRTQGGVEGATVMTLLMMMDDIWFSIFRVSLQIYSGLPEGFSFRFD